LRPDLHTGRPAIGAQVAAPIRPTAGSVSALGAINTYRAGPAAGGL